MRYSQSLLIIHYLWWAFACFSFPFLSLFLLLSVKGKLHLCFVFFGSSLSFVVSYVSRCSGHQGCEALSVSLHTVEEVGVWSSVLLKMMSSPQSFFFLIHLWVSLQSVNIAFPLSLPATCVCWHDCSPLWRLNVLEIVIIFVCTSQKIAYVWRDNMPHKRQKRQNCSFSIIIYYCCEVMSFLLIPSPS